ncbi:MAG TPA: ATP-binding protein [Armatimonadota bacterium]
MALPTQKTPPKSDFRDMLTLLYGLPGAGKSTLLSNADGALFMATEPGLNSLEVFQQPITSWRDFNNTACDILEGGHDYRSIIIDTADNAVKFCSEFICEQWKIKHPSDLPMGKGWSLITNEFMRVINSLALGGYGVYLVSHAKTEEIKTRTGTYTRTVPTLSGKSGEGIVGLVDMIFFMDSDETEGSEGAVIPQTVLRTKPSQYYVAKDRTGRLPDPFVIEYLSGPEDWKNLCKAFNPFYAE